MGHLNGYKENTGQENLIWNCRTCNTATSAWESSTITPFLAGAKARPASFPVSDEIPTFREP